MCLLRVWKVFEMICSLILKGGSIVVYVKGFLPFLQLYIYTLEKKTVFGSFLLLLLMLNYTVKKIQQKRGNRILFPFFPFAAVFNSLNFLVLRNFSFTPRQKQKHLSAFPVYIMWTSNHLLSCFHHVIVKNGCCYLLFFLVLAICKGSTKTTLSKTEFKVFAMTNSTRQVSLTAV